MCLRQPDIIRRDAHRHATRGKKPICAGLLAAMWFALISASAADSSLIEIGTTKTALRLVVGADSRLYQLTYGNVFQPTNRPAKFPSRLDEFHPQSGDGFICEPALQVTHADGNTSILERGGTFVTSLMLWLWSDASQDQVIRNVQRWVRYYGIQEVSLPERANSALSHCDELVDGATPLHQGIVLPSRKQSDSAAIQFTEVK